MRCAVHGNFGIFRFFVRIGNAGKILDFARQVLAAELDLLVDPDEFADQLKAGGTPKDVRKEYTDKIWKLMIVDPKLVDAKNKKGRPPKVIFQWGQTWLFKAVIASITQKFTMFIF